MIGLDLAKVWASCLLALSTVRLDGFSIIAMFSELKPLLEIVLLASSSAYTILKLTEVVLRRWRRYRHRKPRHRSRERSGLT